MIAPDGPVVINRKNAWNKLTEILIKGLQDLTDEEVTRILNLVLDLTSIPEKSQKKEPFLLSLIDPSLKFANKDDQSIKYQLKSIQENHKKELEELEQLWQNHTGTNNFTSGLLSFTKSYLEKLCYVVELMLSAYCWSCRPEAGKKHTLSVNQSEQYKLWHGHRHKALFEKFKAQMPIHIRELTDNGSTDVLSETWAPRNVNNYSSSRKRFNQGTIGELILRANDYQQHGMTVEDAHLLVENLNTKRRECIYTMGIFLAAIKEIRSSR